MNIYSVHYRQEAAASLTGLANEAVFVKEGVAWPAFFVPLIWLIYKRLWIVLVIYIAIELALTGLAGVAGLPDLLTVICSLTLNVIIGFEGNNLYRWGLERRRYKQQAIVVAANLIEAEHRFFKSAEHKLYGRTAPATTIATQVPA